MLLKDHEYDVRKTKEQSEIQHIHPFQTPIFFSNFTLLTLRSVASWKHGQWTVEHNHMNIV